MIDTVESLLGDHPSREKTVVWIEGSGRPKETTYRYFNDILRSSAHENVVGNKRVIPPMIRSPKRRLWFNIWFNSINNNAVKKS